MEEIDSTWKQTERNVKKNGYREGVSAGRDSSFQKGFDDGYAEGYRMGRLLGQAQGKDKYLEITQKSSPVVIPVEDPRRASCLICKEANNTSDKAPLSNKVYETSYDVITSEQKSHNDKIEAKVREKLS